MRYIGTLYSIVPLSGKPKYFKIKSLLVYSLKNKLYIRLLNWPSLTNYFPLTHETKAQIKNR